MPVTGGFAPIPIGGNPRSETGGSAWSTAWYYVPVLTKGFTSSQRLFYTMGDPNTREDGEFLLKPVCY